GGDRAPRRRHWRGGGRRRGSRRRESCARPLQLRSDAPRPARITSRPMSPAAPNDLQTLCLGEAIVDLVGEERVEAMSEISRFVPHFGGTVANVAVAAARVGAPIALVGGAGAD